VCLILTVRDAVTLRRARRVQDTFFFHGNGIKKKKEKKIKKKKKKEHRALAPFGSADGQTVSAFSCFADH